MEWIVGEDLLDMDILKLFVERSKTDYVVPERVGFSLEYQDSYELAVTKDGMSFSPATRKLFSEAIVKGNRIRWRGKYIHIAEAPVFVERIGEKGMRVIFRYVVITKAAYTKWLNNRDKRYIETRDGQILVNR